MKSHVLVFPLLIMMVLCSCEEKKKPVANTDSLQTSLKALRDSTDKAWQLMIQSDDQKIADMKRLLLEISYCKEYNAMRQDSLVKAVDALASTRYKQSSMTDEQINSYDDLTNRLILALKSHALATPELSSHTIAGQLYNDIAKADNDVVQYRALYDRFAFQYNGFIEQNKEALGKDSMPATLPVFSIQIAQ
ncbi:MAG: hypothetical protein MUF42_01415 [Cytophagaceae bacterium]|jgi:hypothetical protein|nr:hypothetical protein [Cytophagaceae bacterium]